MTHFKGFIFWQVVRIRGKGRGLIIHQARPKKISQIPKNLRWRFEHAYTISKHSHTSTWATSIGKESNFCSGRKKAPNTSRMVHLAVLQRGISQKMSDRDEQRWMSTIGIERRVKQTDTTLSSNTQRKRLTQSQTNEHSKSESNPNKR